MNFQEIAQQLLPCWILGLFVIYAVRDSQYKDLLRVEFSPIVKFLKFMLIITAYRFIIFKFFTPHDMIEQIKETSNFIPIGATMGVFWEDAVHALPLVILGKMFGQKTWYKWIRWPLLIGVMLSFGSGHLYQGTFAAAALSFYIPFSMSKGDKYGFGTIMLCHMLYDALTLLSLRWMVGIL
jgi:hypothetical protein